MLSIEDVRAAAKRIEGAAHRTPVLTSRTLDERVGAQVFLKAENFQRVGAFKFRGAFNAISRLTDEQKARGVAAFSSGNHAQAVALAAALAGTSTVILMPTDAPPTKVAATREYGAEVVTYDRYTEDRDALATKLSADRGLTLIPPYDHYDVMAGQGTVALELIEEVGPLGALLVPVGGGGLLAGCATVATALVPGIRMIGVEPAAGDDHARSLAAGHRVAIEVPRTIADGQAVATPGELTFAVNQSLVEAFALVSDDEIRAAMAFAFERLKIVVEPSGASALAALLSGRVPGLPERVGVVLSGGNVGLQRFHDLLGPGRPEH
ncbi:Pyridoxal-5'-phosphate-dependent protein beta subunit [Kribbella flavida DSM 17836]|uniref:threonine ammonia-lyase n=1 Tax=Kribbella flavida (strain DSM 17836 / JCM 10339 / NBRC 14399) TaxID=479435 RepID=D2PXA5_KRIFD|nr:pyridoxal-phosphate dependent enzyme [Kribbella flavida]ADB29753.1 Pyridoxal-5'-phosphate-dependent protein beta subunit [Kribbella flavida DSM 17836]